MRESHPLRSRTPWIRRHSYYVHADHPNADRRRGPAQTHESGRHAARYRLALRHRIAGQATGTRRRRFTHPVPSIVPADRVRPVGHSARPRRLEHLRRRRRLSTRCGHLRTVAQAGDRPGGCALCAAGRAAHRRTLAASGRSRAGPLALGNDAAGPHLPPAAQAYQPARHRLVDLRSHRHHGCAGGHRSRRGRHLHCHRRHSYPRALSRCSPFPLSVTCCT